MATGKTTWFDPYKGYGFITDEHGNEYFAHWKNIRGVGFKKLTKNTYVSFIPTFEGDRAVAIAIVPAA